MPRMTRKEVSERLNQIKAILKEGVTDYKEVAARMKEKTGKTVGYRTFLYAAGLKATPIHTEVNGREFPVLKVRAGENGLEILQGTKWVQVTGQHKMLADDDQVKAAAKALRSFLNSLPADISRKVAQELNA